MSLENRIILIRNSIQSKTLWISHSETLPLCLKMLVDYSHLFVDRALKTHFLSSAKFDEGENEKIFLKGRNQNIRYESRHSIVLQLAYSKRVHSYYRLFFSSHESTCEYRIGEFRNCSQQERRKRDSLISMLIGKRP